MSDHPQKPPSILLQGFNRLPSLLIDARLQLRLLRWLIPACLVLLVVIYEFGSSQLIHENFGYVYHALADTLLFGTVGPILVFMLLSLLERWLDERDTSDWQAQLLAQAREDTRNSRQLNDNAIQTLFAARLIIGTLSDICPDLPPEVITQTEAANHELKREIQQLRLYLQDKKFVEA